MSSRGQIPRNYTRVFPVYAYYSIYRDASKEGLTRLIAPDGKQLTANALKIEIWLYTTFFEFQRLVSDENKSVGRAIRAI